MNVGSFLYTGEVVMLITKCLKIIIFDEDLSSGQQFFCASADIVDDILKYNYCKHHNPISLLTPMCQDTPCRMSNMCDNVCNFYELLYTFT